MSYPFEERHSIAFKDREDFNTVSDWTGLEKLGVVDICYSEMMFILDTKQNLEEFEGCILWNHIKPDRYTTS